MKPTKRIFLIMSIVLFPFLAQADFPVSYQGKLANTEGVPISGTVSNTISLYTVIEGGEAVWSEYHDKVKVENGIFRPRKKNYSLYMECKNLHQISRICVNNWTKGSKILK